MGHPTAVLPRQADRVLISVNPKAGRRSAKRRTERLADTLKRQGLSVEVSSDLAEVAAAADRLHAEGRLRALVGVGGDGTAAELVNRTAPGVPIALLPSGTANLLARHFRLPFEPEKLGRLIAEGSHVRLDAGRAAGRIFLLMVGCGFDAEVVRRVHDARHAGGGGHIGYLSYIKPILQSIRSYEYPEITVYCDESSDVAVDAPDAPAVVGRWVFVCNLPRYGWGLKLAPDAVGTDGILDLCTYGRGSLVGALRFLLAVQFGARHGRMADCTIGRARRFRITSDKPVAYQLDGDPGGFLPLEIEVLPDRLTLIVPR